jgi:hypothetical protein
LITRLTANGIQIVSFDPPIILYIRANEGVVVSAGITSYTLVGSSANCYVDGGCPNDQCNWYCVRRVTEWGRTYKLQAIELVDWDTGEVYGSTNSTSLTFQVGRNTIVRFKYVMTESWSRSWTVIPPPPSPPINKCPEILNDQNKRCTGDWCYCLSQLDPEAWKKEACCYTIKSCLRVGVDFCCSGAEKYSCLSSRSGQGGESCVKFTLAEVQQGVKKPLSPVSWSASWSLKSGWELKDIGRIGPNICLQPSVASGSASGCCTAGPSDRCEAVDVGPNVIYSVTIMVIFKVKNTVAG